LYTTVFHVILQHSTVSSQPQTIQPVVSRYTDRATQPTCIPQYFTLFYNTVQSYHNHKSSSGLRLTVCCPHIAWDFWLVFQVEAGTSLTAFSELPASQYTRDVVHLYLWKLHMLYLFVLQ